MFDQPPAKDIKSTFPNVPFFVADKAQNRLVVEYAVSLTSKGIGQLMFLLRV